MNSYLSKDYLDWFYSNALDEPYEVLRRDLSPSKRNSRKTMRRPQHESYSDSTSAEEDSQKEEKCSIFNCNMFEKSQKTLKIKDALVFGWRENVLAEKKKLLVKLVRSKATTKVSRSIGKGKNYANFLH